MANLWQKTEGLTNMKINVAMKPRNQSCCEDGRVLFMDASLHSMCHLLSVGMRSSVDMSIISGVALKDKVRHHLLGHSFGTVEQVWHFTAKEWKLLKEQRKRYSMLNPMYTNI